MDSDAYAGTPLTVADHTYAVAAVMAQPRRVLGGLRSPGDVAPDPALTDELRERLGGKSVDQMTAVIVSSSARSAEPFDAEMSTGDVGTIAVADAVGVAVGAIAAGPAGAIALAIAFSVATYEVLSIPA